MLVFFIPGSHNTHRWIRFGSHFTFQPSEIAKLVLVLFLAWFLHTRLDAMRDWQHTLLRAAIVPLVFILLIVKQPDLGTSLVLAGVTAMLLLLAGMEWRYLIGAFAAALPGAGLAALHGSVAARSACWSSSIPIAIRRMPGFSYHIQSLIAVGSGGFSGRGYMEGMQKLFYLPEASTDFIFANIAEELGFIGAHLHRFARLSFLACAGFATAFRSKDPFARLVAFGITVGILLQAFFNISVVLSLVPTKGIPLPLISSGGTSLFLHAGVHRDSAEHFAEKLTSMMSTTFDSSLYFSTLLTRCWKRARIR